MFKSNLAAILFIVSIVAFYFYFSNKLPPGVEPKGNELIVAQIELWTAIISLLGALILIIIEIITKKK
jgi:hypothetical protein